MTERRRRPPRVRVRRWKPEDIPRIVECQRAAYSDYPDSGMYDARIYEMQLAAFPEGQVLVEAGGEIVGYATSIIVQLDDAPHLYEYDELTGAGTFSTHAPAGDTLYGADIAVHPAWRGQGVAQRLYVARKALMKRYNLRRMVAYGRLPGYGAHAGELTAQEYVAAVAEGRLKDSALSAHLKAGYRVLSVGMNIMRDEPSLDYATLLELENPDYDPHKRRIAAAPIRRPARRARVCAAQYLMRRVESFDDLARSVRFFVEAADEYHAHFLVLPEYFMAALFGLAPRDRVGEQAFRWVAQYTEPLRELFVECAREYNLYIIAGSMPDIVDGEPRNVSYLVSPGGHVYAQEKLHVTPHERELWGVRPGRGVRVFETPFGRIAIQVCYDIEFPELSRLLTLAGVELVFVPFSTDEINAYHRVRYSAQARAIENGIYVVLAGSTGNLPVRNQLLNYSRSAILTPSDFGFPDRAVAAEADPNVETVVIADLDFTTLAEHRRQGAVRPLADRRPDIYELSAREHIEVIHVE
ncbi:MAG: GNAT family N-acetyltransferase [Myxococcales bacterium]|nr:GNAT family N-acetyltransferase [Myxococcales bacterium]